MSYQTAHETARAKASEILGCEAKDFYRTCDKRHIQFSCETSGGFYFDLTRRLDTYSLDEIQPLWDHLFDGVRLYFDSLNHQVDPEAMTDTEKLHAVEAWTDFWQRLGSGEHRLFAEDDPDQLLNGAALYRLGYYVRVGNRADQSGGGSELSGEPIITEERFAGYLATNLQYRLIGLYRRAESNTPNDAAPILYEVMTASEIAEQFAVDHDTIRVSIHKGYIPARKSGGTWLIRRADALKRWRSKKID
jgi:excisionase family DNA binding protein